MPSLPELLGSMHLSDTHMRLADSGTKATQKEAQAQMILVDEPAMDQLLATTTMAKLRRKKKERAIPVSFELEVKPGEQRLTAENVLAFIEGTDKKDEIVVLTAHYDHIGVQDGVVYNGADDDGTGTVAIIEMAQAFMQAKKAGHGPRRSVLVMPVSGEEKGLLGSRYYSEHPVFPLANTVADINIDMIGRRDSAHATSPPYIYIIGSDRLSSGLHRANEQANSLYTKLDLDYTFNAESDPNRFYYRSDHYNFARKGVPSVFYFSGVHEDYHQPGDDVEKIDFGLLHQRTLLAFYTAWILANQEERIVVDKPVKP
ncbi:MAG: M28 family peptidase [Flavobacteriales bacterium]|nr:M28 family peptidase [Flavobacteriales bacterium]